MPRGASCWLVSIRPPVISAPSLKNLLIPSSAASSPPKPPNSNEFHAQDT